MPSTGAISRDLNSLGQALQSGNLSQAQQAYSNVQQDVQQAGGHHHHHHHGGDNSQNSSSSSSTLGQDFTALGNALQANDISAAQQAYTKFQTDLQQYFSLPGLNAGSGNNTEQVVQPQAGMLSATA